jgi:hypothetical protein
MPELTRSNPSFALVNLKLDAVALCNEGANSRADILLTKRKESQIMPNTFDELLKELTPESADLVTKHIATLEATHATAVSTLQGKVDTLEKAKPAAPAAAVTTPSFEEMLKSVAPEVQEQFTKMQGTISALVSAQADSLAAAHYEKCKALPVEETALKSILKTASPAVIEALEKAAQAVSTNVLTPKGSDGTGEFQKTDADSHYDTLAKSARAIVAADTEGKTTFEAAFMTACTRNPEVYKSYAEGVR